MSLSTGYEPQPAQKVLYVEDDPQLCRLMHLSLRRHGFQVEVAQSGREAMALMREQAFQALLIDYTLPDTDGLTLARTLQGQAPDTPMLMVTGAGHEKLAVDALKQGFRDYVVKDPHGSYFQSIPLLIQQAINRNTHEQVRLEAEGARNRLIHDLNAFAQNVAHDLKSPLSGLTGLLNMLQEADPNTPAYHDLVRSLHGQVDKMQIIIDELLLMARLKDSEVTRETVDMKPIVLNVLHRFEREIQTLEAHVELQDLPDALGRAPWLEEVWANLISNALKYGGKRPHLQIGGSADPRHLIRYWVKDHGPGLPPSAHKRIFRPQVRLARTRHLEGEGLGLSIVKRIVEKLGGEVGAENRPEGGACFFFYLPDPHYFSRENRSKSTFSSQQPRIWA